MSEAIFSFQTLKYFKSVLLSLLAANGLVAVRLIIDSLHPELIEAWNGFVVLLLVYSNYGRR